MVFILKAIPTAVTILVLLLLFLGGDDFFSDLDKDGIKDYKDNCPNVPNYSSDSADEKIGNNCKP
jgi:hypothetical protein